MAYVKTVWQTGDVITAAKLNNMEGGIESGQGFIITGAFSDVGGERWFTFDKTFTEIKNAMDAGIMPVVYFPEDGEAPAAYYTILFAKFSPTKELQLDAQRYLVARDVNDNDIPVVIIEE